ncbi:uracil-DNA glycosylase [Mycoplasma miroungirhinis]|uniref:Uracil-DNA glycosylase n=1 Tax=Mycoplasma miroungirhinis TaxID=754516 RepID=A0A6M4JDS9_9MOLU|nr:uracil-DNA glycosylase [Mycoplasma miroungirhinis]QJR44398.1 uracil-DNA glycosylase [Mycoplasma miroungirhinis]
MRFNLKQFLEEESQKEYFINLQNALNNENKEIVPSKNNWYKAFDLDWYNIQIIILGQDPYYTPNTADGLAFSTNDKKIPSSLKNIFKEIKATYPHSVFETNNLDYWKQQGILLSNTKLTTVLNQALAHENIGWEIFVTNAIKKILELNENVIFLCFGQKALKFIENLNTKQHFVLHTSHPSGLSCYRGFSGSNIFLEANNILKSLNKKTIDWSTKIVKYKEIYE